MRLPLLDNNPDDEFTYDIYVFTGFKTDGQTNSNIFVKLTGSDGTTGVRKLDDGIRKVCINPKRLSRNIIILILLLGVPSWGNETTCSHNVIHFGKAAES